MHILLEYIIGFIDLGPNRFVLFPRMPGAWQNSKIYLEIKARSFALEGMFREDGTLECTATHPSGAPVPVSTKNFQFTNVVLVEEKITVPDATQPSNGAQNGEKSEVRSSESGVREKTEKAKN